MTVGLHIWGSILAIYVIGPGLIANGLLKRFWGRARPDTITEFGGQATFTPPGQIADPCASNCSFVSGEASGATAFLISIFILTRNLPSQTHRSLWRGIGMLVFLTVGTLRIGLGRHFASDVIFAVLFRASYERESGPKQKSRA